MTHLDWALRYLKNGWSVIPLKPKSKEPLISQTEFFTRRATEDEVRKWFTITPNANIGLVTGSISRLCVLDVDGLAGLKYLQENRITSPVTVITGSGAKHLYFKYNGEESKKIWRGKNPHEEVFLRTDELILVAPPSIHPNGKRYRWVNPVLNVEKLSEIPGSVLASPVPLKMPEVSNESGWISQALEDIKNGHTHNTLVRVLGKFRAHNFSEEDTRKLLLPYASSGGMGTSELESKISEIWGRYEPNNDRIGNQVIHGVYKSDSTISIKSPANDNDWEQFNNKLDLGQSETIKSGFKSLDSMLEGGLKSERLFTVAARTGTGKTNFGIALSFNLCKQGKKVLYFPTEFSFKKIFDRFIQYYPEPEAARRDPFYVVDSFSPNLSQVEEAIKQINPDVFIFDHINHLGEEKELLGTFMQGCNFLQRKYQAQGIMVAQLNRQADWVDNGERVQPRMSMIKGSGTIEQASSRVLLLSEVRVTPEYNEIVGVLDKNDSGDKGIIQFGLYKNPYIFRELPQ